MSSCAVLLRKGVNRETMGFFVSSWSLRMQALLFAFCSLFVISTFAQDTINPPLPALPRAFSVMAETNDLESSTTSYTFGYYDYQNDRYRIEEHSQTSAIVTIVLPREKTSYRLVVGTSDCRTEHDVSNTDIIGGEFFFFAQELNYTYGGNNNARGIVTDAWNGTWPAGSGPSTFNDMPANFTLLYQFAVTNWNMRSGSSSGYRVPVKASVEGTIFVNGTSKMLSRQYNFMDFFYGNLSDTLFAEPYACIPKPPTYSKGEAFTAGGIAGVVVAGIIILAAIVGRVIYLRRNPVSDRGHRLADDAVM